MNSIWLQSQVCSATIVSLSKVQLLAVNPPNTKAMGLEKTNSTPHQHPNCPVRCSSLSNQMLHCRRRQERKMDTQHSEHTHTLIQCCYTWLTALTAKCLPNKSFLSDIWVIQIKCSQNKWGQWPQRGYVTAAFHHVFGRVVLLLSGWMDWRKKFLFVACALSGNYWHNPISIRGVFTANRFSCFFIWKHEDIFVALHPSQVLIYGCFCNNISLLLYFF